MKIFLKKLLPVFAMAYLKGLLSLLGKVLEKRPIDAQVFFSDSQHIFFGYYDVSPFSYDGRYLLAQRVSMDNVSPHTENPELELGYFDLSKAPSSAFQAFAKTRTWNWQQGCRMQWFPQNRSATQTVIYNTMKNQKYIAIIQNIISKEIVCELPSPVYSVDPNGNFALGLDFDRLHKCRPGYGYNNVMQSYNKDEIVRIDIPSGETRLMLRMEDVLKHNPLGSMDGAEHYFNHLSVSPEGKKFMVTHLWVSSSGKRYSRLLVGDCNEESPIICPNNLGHTSHYAWINESEILLFSTQPDGKARYCRYSLKGGPSSLITPQKLTQDGHPTWCSENVLITDTYPDITRRQYLLSLNIKTNKLKKLASFYLPENYQGEMRCDLHPRVNAAQDSVCVDIVRNGRRAMCIILLQINGKK